MEILNNIGQTIAAFIFVLGVMIFIHELGHHLVAKWFGIRVETFSLGFGPRLFGFLWGGTDYRVSLLPLGGYVKMAGEHVTDELTGAPDEFMSRPRWQRFLVAVAGPVMNVSLAVVLLAGNFMAGIEVSAHREQPPVIGYIAKESPAQAAGLEIGDRIVAVDGEATPTWQDADIQIAINGEKDILLTVERDGRQLRLPVSVKGVGRSRQGYLGVAPRMPFIINEVNSGSPAERAGLQPEDEILQGQSGDETADGFFAIQEMISNSQGREVQFEIRRGEQTLHLAITPESLTAPTGEEYVGIGVVRNIPSIFRQYGFVDAFRESVGQNVYLTALLFEILGRIITGETPVSNLSGPIEIAQFSGAAASQGMAALIGFMAFISLQLGILNLMPIPVLDGGTIAMLAIEGVMGRDLSIRAKERILQAGLFFLVLLMGFVILNDISKLL